jgi:hypothetical protein
VLDPKFLSESLPFVSVAEQAFAVQPPNNRGGVLPLCANSEEEFLKEPEFENSFGQNQIGFKITIKRQIMEEENESELVAEKNINSKQDRHTSKRALNFNAVKFKL